MITRRFGARVFLIFVYLFVLGPLLIVIFDSFNSATSFPSPFESATLQWYRALFHHDEFLASMRVSAVVAGLAATISTVLGFFAAYALVRYPLPGKNLIQTFLLGPLLVPQIIIGLAMLQLLSVAGFQITLADLVMVHAVYVMPFVVRLIMTGLARFDFSLEDAAHSLGASTGRTLWHVTLPLARSGLIAGFLFAFILSFVNLPLSLFLTNPGTATLPVTMFAYMESRIDPVVAAVASLIVVAAMGITILLERGLRLRLLG